MKCEVVVKKGIDRMIERRYGNAGVHDSIHVHMDSHNRSTWTWRLYQTDIFEYMETTNGMAVIRTRTGGYDTATTKSRIRTICKQLNIKYGTHITPILDNDWSVAWEGTAFL